MMQCTDLPVGLIDAADRFHARIKPGWTAPSALIRTTRVLVVKLETQGLRPVPLTADTAG